MCTRLYCWVSGIKSCDQKIEILVIIDVVRVLLFVHFFTERVEQRQWTVTETGKFV